MKAVAGKVGGGVTPAAVAIVCLLAFSLAVVQGSPGAIKLIGPVLVIVGVVLASYRALFRWHNLLAMLLLVILFIPIRRYTLGGGLPFQLEPYRLFVGLLLVGWLASLLVDPRVRVRRSFLDGPLLAVTAVAFVTVLANIGSISSQGIWQEVTKKLTFFLSFLFVFYLFVSLVRTRRQLDQLLRVLVTGGAVLAVFALIEFNTGYDFFDHLHHFIPVLHLQDLPFQSLEVRGGKTRVYASSEHPIALGAAFVMLTPIAVYFAKRNGGARWWVAAGLLAIGSLATISRTSILMIIVTAFIYYRLRPQEIKRLWPLLVPAIVIIHLALPGSLGTLQEAFFPKGGLIAEQQGAQNTRGSGRVADLGPGVSQWAQQPLFGRGYGTRITDQGAHQNADILDDQWLGTLLETGILGVAAWLWVFTRFIRRMMRRARAEAGDEAYFFAGLAAAAISYAVSMLFYDAFSFIQVTFFLFFVMAFGCARVAIDDRERAAAAPA
jgi:hypothetical protein